MNSDGSVQRQQLGIVKWSEHNWTWKRKMWIEEWMWLLELANMRQLLPEPAIEVKPMKMKTHNFRISSHSNINENAKHKWYQENSLLRLQRVVQP